MARTATEKVTKTVKASKPKKVESSKTAKALKDEVLPLEEEMLKTKAKASKASVTAKADSAKAAKSTASASAKADAAKEAKADAAAAADEGSEVVGSASEKASGNQSLFRGLKILELLSDFPNGCALQKLSQLAELNKSTVHRMLQGLESAGYVTHGEISGSYRLTSKLAGIGHKSLSSLNILSVAAPHLNNLNYNTGETINFSMREDDHVILIYKLEPTLGMMRTRAYLGQHMCLHNSAMGKIFMAFGNEDYPRQYWETHQDVIVPLTANTIVDLDKMYKELEVIRKKEISYDNEENELGVFCIAAPVFDIHERVAYSVSISLSTSRLKQVGKDTLIKQLKETAQAISSELGYLPPKKK